MRELPEPEGQLAWQTYTRDQVLAIQRQAYEDALRDAADRADSVGHHWSGAPAHAFFELADSLRAMLTTSKEEQKPQKRHACDDPLCAVCGNPL